MEDLDSCLHAAPYEQTNIPLPNIPGILLLPRPIYHVSQAGGIFSRLLGLISRKWNANLLWLSGCRMGMVRVKSATHGAAQYWAMCYTLLRLVWPFKMAAHAQNRVGRGGRGRQSLLPNAGLYWPSGFLTGSSQLERKQVKWQAWGCGVILERLTR